MANETKKKDTLFTVNVPKVDLVEGYGSEPVEIQNPFSTIGQKYEDFKTSLEYPSTQPEKRSMPEPMASKDTTMFPSLSGYYSSDEKGTPYSGIMDKISYAQAKGDLPSLSGMASNIKTGFQSLIGQQPQAVPQTTQTAPEGSSFLKDAGKALAYGLLGAGMGYGGASPSQIYGTFQAGKEAYELDNPESSTSQQYTNLVKNYSRLLGIPEETYLKTGAQLTARSLAPAVKELSDMYGEKERNRRSYAAQSNMMNRYEQQLALRKTLDISQNLEGDLLANKNAIDSIDKMIEIAKKKGGWDKTLGVLGKATGNIFGGDPDFANFEGLRGELPYILARIYGERGALSNPDIIAASKGIPSALSEKQFTIKALENLKAKLQSQTGNIMEKYKNMYQDIGETTGVETKQPSGLKNTVGRAKSESGIFGKN